MNRYIVFMLLLLGVQTARPQKVTLDQRTVDMGQLLWKTPKTAVIHVGNKDGRHQLLVTHVDAGCGCMKTEWPQKAISKGANGEIRLTYDARQLGHFDRLVEVYTNQKGQQPELIRVKGHVVTSLTKSIEETYPYRIDNVCLSTNNIEFPDVSRGDSAKVYIDLLNDGNEVYTPQLMHLPAYITARPIPQMVARGRRGRIELTLHGDLMPSLGLNQTQIYLARFSGDRVGTDNDLTVSAVLLPDVHEAASQVHQPRLSLSTTELNLGKLGRKSKLKGKVTIENKGDAPLQMSHIQSFNQAVSVSLPGRELKPGERITMNITMEAKYLAQSKAEPRVLIITNDPTHCKEVVNVVFER